MAKHALVLGSGQSVNSGSTVAITVGKSTDAALHKVPSQGPFQLEAASLAPPAVSIQQQGFCQEVATRTEAPQRRSTRVVYESKWSVFVKWCESNQVDFRSPSIKQIADFLLFLFQERHLQPNTIDSYRTAIVDKIRNDTVNISKEENMTRLLDSFH